MRLTHKAVVTKEYVEDINGEKETISVEYNHVIDSNFVYVIIAKLCNKLGQLEDIEEELGIDLITFFKYLSANKVFYKENGGLFQAIVVSIDKKGIIVVQKGFEWGECEFHLYFKDYGKKNDDGWALTEEELL